MGEHNRGSKTTRSGELFCTYYAYPGPYPEATRDTRSAKRSISGQGRDLLPAQGASGACAAPEWRWMEAGAGVGAGANAVHGGRRTDEVDGCVAACTAHDGVPGGPQHVGGANGHHAPVHTRVQAWTWKHLKGNGGQSLVKLLGKEGQSLCKIKRWGGSIPRESKREGGERKGGGARGRSTCEPPTWRQQQRQRQIEHCHEQSQHQPHGTRD